MSISDLLGMDLPAVIVEDVVVPAQKLNPFDFTYAIGYTKEDLFEENEDAEKYYNTYIVNRALSFSADIVLFANEMNKYSNIIPKRVQFDLLRSVVRKRKRTDKWIKAEKESEDIEAIKEYYNYSNEKAKQALTLLMPDELDQIKARLNKGGIKTAKRTRKTSNERE